MAANLGDWADFDALTHGIKHNTVDKLKAIVNGVNYECMTNLSKTGKKQDLINRIVYTMESWRTANAVDRWKKAKDVLQQVRNTGSWTTTRGASAPGPVVAMPSFSGSVHGTVNPPFQVNPGAGGSATYNAVAGSSTGTARYDPYAPPRLPVPQRKPVPGPSTAASPPKGGLRFKPSPFFRVDSAVSSVVECPESSSATDRRSQALMFSLQPDVLAKLNAPKSKYQLRLFCTSSVFHSPNSATFRTTSGPCPIEFPPTCEVRVNTVLLTANLKGMKKKPGTAPPADLGQTVKLVAGAQNRLEMVYVNSQQPAQPKKYYLVVQLVETKTIDEIVEQLKKGKYRTSAEILAQMKANSADDDDIVSGPQKMSLKDPLSYARVVIPSRSAHCVHSQCFDAKMWFAVNEQTTTWSCPVCEKTLNHEDLIVDGYFDDILNSTPDSVEDVIVEADGQWHTADDKYGSGAWKAAHPIVPKIPHPPSPRKVVPSPSKASSSNGANGKTNGKGSEILILDSDDEDDNRVKREMSPSLASAVQQSQSNGPNDIIDLTLSDSEDEAPPPPSRSIEKRKAVDEPNAATKKARIEMPPLLPPIRTSSANLDMASGIYSAHPSQSNGYGINGASGYGNAPYQSTNGARMSMTSRTPSGSGSPANRFPTLTSPMEYLTMSREPRPYSSVGSPTQSRTSSGMTMNGGLPPPHSPFQLPTRMETGSSGSQRGW